MGWVLRTRRWVIGGPWRRRRVRVIIGMSVGRLLSPAVPVYIRVDIGLWYLGYPPRPVGSWSSNECGSGTWARATRNHLWEFRYGLRSLTQDGVTALYFVYPQWTFCAAHTVAPVHLSCHLSKKKSVFHR